MSIKPVPCFTAVCDWHGCGADVMADSDYVGGDMALVESALEDAECDGWHTGRDGTSHYCDKHPTVWASDHELGEPFPAPPYLLIHDGDTDTHDDDGKVSLVLPALEDPRQGSLLDATDPYDKVVWVQGHRHSEPVCAWPDCATYLTREQMAAAREAGIR